MLFDDLANSCKETQYFHSSCCKPTIYQGEDNTVLWFTCPLHYCFIKAGYESQVRAVTSTALRNAIITQKKLRMTNYRNENYA